MKYVVLYTLWILPTLLAAQSRYYVSGFATGTNTGASWQDAFTDLQVALETAVAGDTVWVAEGTYYPTDSANRFVSFEPKSGVRLYGGFIGTETTLDQRDWQAHPTVLSGDIGAPGDSTDNSLNVMYLHQPDSFTVVDGFTMCNGNADYTGGFTSSRHRYKSGGGLYIEGKDWEAYPTIQNCVFIHNTARNFGGGVVVNGEGLGSIAPKFYNCHFENNRCVSSGGGLAWLGASWVEREKDIELCNFNINIAQRGGGLYYIDSDRIDLFEIFASNFNMNHSMVSGGGINQFVGRLSGAICKLNSCNFIQNTSSSSSAALSVNSLNMDICSKYEIESCFFKNNYRTTVGTSNLAQISLNQSGDSTTYISIKSSIFEMNIEESNFISVGIDKGSVLIINNKFCNNEIGVLLTINADLLLFDKNIITNNIIQLACIQIGVEYCDTDIFNSIFSFKQSIISVFQINGDSFRFINNNIVDDHNNVAEIQVNSFLVTNVISLNDQGAFLANSTSSPTTISHSYIPGLDCSTLPPNVTCGPGIITSGDPMFVNPDSNNYRLQPCSPLRDAGTNSSVPPWLLTDIDGRPRILGGTVDIGAYEIPDFAATAAPTVQGTCTDATNGSVAFETEGGCPPFTYLWQPGNGGGTSATGLAPGTYVFTVTDAGGRSFLDTVAVPELPDPQIRADSMPISCYGQSDALLAVAPFSGPEPFTFLWTGGVTDSIFGPVGPGAYSVTATDANGCFTTYTYFLTAPDSLQFSAVVQDASGPVIPDGSVTVTAVLGGTGPYGYLWSDGSTGPVLDNIPPGTYTVTITDTRGCTAVSTYEVTFTIGTASPGETIAFSLYPNPAEHTVWLDLGGSGSYLLEMYDASGRRVLQGNVASGRQQVVLDGLAAGTYVAVVKNEKGSVVGSGKVVVK